MSGSRARAMISVATRDGLGKSTWAFSRFSKSCDNIRPGNRGKCGRPLLRKGIGGTNSHLSRPMDRIAVQLQVDTQSVATENTGLLCPRRGTQAANGGRL